MHGNCILLQSIWDKHCEKYCFQPDEYPCKLSVSWNVVTMMKLLKLFNLVRRIIMKPHLHGLGRIDHLQPATPLQTDNIMASKIINDTIRQNNPNLWTCMSTGFDKANFTSFGALAPPIGWLLFKHHPTSHLQAVHPTYVHIPAPATSYYACLSDPLWSVWVRVSW